MIVWFSCRLGNAMVVGDNTQQGLPRQTPQQPERFLTPVPILLYMPSLILRYQTSSFLKTPASPGPLVHVCPSLAFHSLPLATPATTGHTCLCTSHIVLTLENGKASPNNNQFHPAYRN